MPTIAYTRRPEIGSPPAAPRTGRRLHGGVQGGFTLIELLTVTIIIGVLAGLLMPAVSAARAASRKTECSNNLRQFGVGMMAHADRNKGRFCSGAFDWQHEGAVTEVGWVADLVGEGVNVGSMLCPANQARLSTVVHQLLTLDSSDFPSDECSDSLGGEESTLPDGTTFKNPCREILEDPSAYPVDSQARVDLIDEKVIGKHYNTNYVASWLLVRSKPRLDDAGNLESTASLCPTELTSKTATIGPLTTTQIDSAKIASSTVPLLGDGAMAGYLTTKIGALEAGIPITGTMTRGPVRKTDLEPPTFAASTPREDWWPVWTSETLQDYRGFQPAHKGVVNVLMADGSVRAFTDTNGDQLLNNGFPTQTPTVQSGFQDDEVEVEPESMFSSASLKGF